MKKNYYSQLNNKTKYKEYLYSGFLGKLFNINHQLMEKYNFKPMNKILEIGGGIRSSYKLYKISF